MYYFIKDNKYSPKSISNSSLDGLKNTMKSQINKKYSLETLKKLEKYKKFTSSDAITEFANQYNLQTNIKSSNSLKITQSDDENLRDFYKGEASVAIKRIKMEDKFLNKSDDGEINLGPSLKRKFLRHSSKKNDKLTKKKMSGRSYSSSVISRNSDSDSSSDSLSQNSSPIKKSRPIKKHVLTSTEEPSNVVIGSNVVVRYGRGKLIKLYEAKVIQINNEGKINMYLVHYKGWNSRYDEWVGADKISLNSNLTSYNRRGILVDHKENTDEETSHKFNDNIQSLYTQENSLSSEVETDPIIPKIYKKPHKNDEVLLKSNRQLNQNSQNSISLLNTFSNTSSSHIVPFISKRMTRNSLQDFMLSTAIVESIKGINNYNKKCPTTIKNDNNKDNLGLNRISKDPQSNGVQDIKKILSEELNFKSEEIVDLHNEPISILHVNKSKQIGNQFQDTNGAELCALPEESVLHKIDSSSTSNSEENFHDWFKIDPVTYLETSSTLTENDEIVLSGILESMEKTNRELRIRYIFLERCVGLIDKRLKNISPNKRPKKKQRNYPSNKQHRMSDTSSSDDFTDSYSKKTFKSVPIKTQT